MLNNNVMFILILCVLFIGFPKIISLATQLPSNTDQKLLINQTVVEENSNSSVSSATASKVLEFWKKNLPKFQFGTRKNIVPIFGMTGSGKTTLGLHQTGADLISIEISGTGEFILVDKLNRISDDTTIKSKTIVPELMIDQQSGTAHFDCPGFSDTRGIEYDLSVVYFIKKLLEFAESVKFVFTIASSSVRMSGDRHEFMELARYATTLIKDIEKFRNGIAMVVTKVPNELHVDDQTFINRTIYFLNKTKTSLIRDNNGTAITDVEREFNENVIKFIDILMEKRGNNYTRIGIFRLASESGPVNQMAIFQQERQDISTIINQNIQYVKKDNSDFRFTMSMDSMNVVHDLIKDIERDLLADLQSIDSKLKQVYVQKEINTYDSNALYSAMSMGYQQLTQIESVQPKRFAIGILNATKALGIGIPNSFFEHINAIEFLTTISDHNNADYNRLAYNIQFKLTTDFLDNSQKWYRFLINLGNFLSEYRIQKNVLDYQSITTQLLYQTQHENNNLYECINVNETYLKPFLDRVGYGFLLDIENMQINNVKMNRLHAVVNQTMNDRIYASCSANQLQIHGFNVKMSDISNFICFQNAIKIDIFAMNKVFFDVDFVKTDQTADLSIIAPTWEIITDTLNPAAVRKISLIGKNGADFDSSASSGIKNSENGQNGKSGRPGEPGGRFFGIANKFIDEQKLHIYAIGGRGGTGQTGGKGSDGITGEDPPTTGVKIVDQWFNRFRTKHWQENCGWFRNCDQIYEVKSGLPSRPGNGGDGGRGSYGGKAGQILIISADKKPEIVTISRDGAVGGSGKGGNPGSPAKERIYRFRFKGGSNMPNLRRKRTVIIHNPFLPESDQIPDRPEIISNQVIEYTASKGIDGSSNSGMIPPEVAEFRHLSKIINAYKAYIRGNLPNNILELQLGNFLHHVENNASIQNLYDIMGLIDDLFSIENQFAQMKVKTVFVSSIESLLHRIEIYIGMHQIDDVHKYVLNLIYTAALSKLCALKKPANHVSIVDLLGYINIVDNHIAKWHDASIEAHHWNTLNDYKIDLNEKIAAGSHFIDTKILPEIEQTFIETDRNILDLIDETLNRQYETEMEISKFSELEQKLKKALVLETILLPLKAAATAISFFGPIGQSISTGVQGSTMIAESFLPTNLNQQANGQLSMLAIRLNTTMFKIRNSFNYKQQLLNEQLNDIENDIKSYLKDHNDNSSATTTTTTHFNDILRKINTIKSDLHMERPQNGNKTILVSTDELRIEFKAFLAAKKESISKVSKSNVQKMGEKSLQMMDKFQKIINLADVTISIYKQLQNRIDKIDEIHRTIEHLHDQLQVWKLHEKNIHDIMLPRLHEIESIIDTIVHNSNGKAHIELDVIKWNIESSLKDLKLLFDNMSREFTVRYDLGRCIQKMQEAVAIVLDIYKRIDSYNENSKLATMITNTVSDIFENTIITDTNLTESVLKLKQIIETNLILEKYQMVLYAFKQHRFPFAWIQLPSELQYNDTASLLRNVIKQMATFKEDIQTSKSSINKYDREVFGNVGFGRRSSSMNNQAGKAEPFYVWKNSVHKNEIQKLLLGEEITMTSEIANGLNMNAVKFNEIEIRLKASNQSTQFELNRVMNNFTVTMSMVGNNYYRCDSRVYSISADDNIVIEYSVAFDSNNNNYDDSHVSNPNSVYEIIQKNDYFLSPYGTWNLKLTNSKTNNFHALTKFLNESIDLELVGHGQYFKNQGSIFTAEICNEQLDQFYNLDSILVDQEQTKYSDLLNRNDEFLTEFI